MIKPPVAIGNGHSKKQETRQPKNHAFCVPRKPTSQRLTSWTEGECVTLAKLQFVDGPLYGLLYMRCDGHWLTDPPKWITVPGSVYRGRHSVYLSNVVRADESRETTFIWRHIWYWSLKQQVVSQNHGDCKTCDRPGPMAEWQRDSLLNCANSAPPLKHCLYMHDIFTVLVRTEFHINYDEMIAW